MPVSMGRRTLIRCGFRVKAALFFGLDKTLPALFPTSIFNSVFVMVLAGAFVSNNSIHCRTIPSYIWK